MLYETMTATAARLIRKYGSAVALVQNPPDPQYEAGTNRPYWIDADGNKTYVLPPALRHDGSAAPRSVDVSEVVDGRIRITDMAFVCVDLPEPTTKDKVEFLGDTYNVVHVVPKYLQGAVIVYFVYARKA